MRVESWSGESLSGLAEWGYRMPWIIKERASLEPSFNVLPSLHLHPFRPESHHHDSNMSLVSARVTDWSRKHQPTPTAVACSEQLELRTNYSAHVCISVLPDRLNESKRWKATTLALAERSKPQSAACVLTEPSKLASPYAQEVLRCVCSSKERTLSLFRYRRKVWRQ